MIWCDHCGLAPEKERDRERLLGEEYQDASIGVTVYGQMEIDRSSDLGLNINNIMGSRIGIEGSAPVDAGEGGSGSGLKGFQQKIH